MQSSQYHSQLHDHYTNDDNSPFRVALSSALALMLALAAFHLSLVATSMPLSNEEHARVERAIEVLETRGFTREAFMLRHTTTFRGSDHWLNRLVARENAFAATNLPFQMITLYKDFYSRATDDTERAMILLHEARHLAGANERSAYSYVWRHRRQLGWTQLTHGTTETYVTIAEQTRENAPDLFDCPSQVWSDCTETLRVSK